MTDASTPESVDPLPLLALGERWHVASVSQRGFRLALAGALAGHLLLTVILTGGLDALLVALGGAPPQMPKPIGDRNGSLDGIAAEVIDAAEFNKRYIAFKTGKSDADAEAAPAAKPSPAPADAPKPPAEPVTELKAADGWVPTEATASIEKPEKKPEKPPERQPEKQPEQPREKPVLSEEEIRSLVSQSVEDLQDSILSVSAPGAARLGDASPFVRAVVRILKQHMPKSRGMKGDVVIQLIVGLSGDVEAIRVVRSSGRPELDRLVADTVYKTRLTPPPATTPPRERLFNITYSYN